MKPRNASGVFLKPKSCPGGGMVDTKDLKSFDHCDRAGSSPAPGTVVRFLTSFSGEFFFMVTHNTTPYFVRDT